jgi:hypothetical protein
VGEFGHFAVEGPVSDAMRAFLTKSGHRGPLP